MDLNRAISKFTESINCKSNYDMFMKCYDELDRKLFFKKQKNKQCQQLENDYRICLTYSNQNKKYSSIAYTKENVAVDLILANRENKSENKVDALNYVTGKITDEDLINKQSNSNKRKKVIEL